MNSRYREGGASDPREPPEDVGAPAAGASMRYVTYEKFRGSLLDALNLQELLDRLSDFLLDSGFAGRSGWGSPGGPAGDPGEDAGDLEGLRDAILRQLMESGQLTPEMMRALRGEGEPNPEVMAEIAALLDEIVEALVREGYLRLDGEAAGGSGPEGEKAPTGPVTGPGSLGRGAARRVDFRLTRKGLDFLSYRALRDLLGAWGQGTPGRHETRRLSTGVEAEASSKPYAYGDVLNLDAPGTLLRAIERQGLRFPLELEPQDLRVHQSIHRASCASVLLLDCSHSMVLYGEDRFTPAKRVALALSHLLRTRFPGDTLRCVLFHDSAEEIPLARLARARVGPYHTNTAEGLRVARRILRTEAKDMRQVVMITDGKPSAMTLPDGRIYKNSMGLDRQIVAEAFREVAACRREGISINTFMLARDPSLVRFVRKVAAIARGKAYFTTPMTLGQYLLLDYMQRKSRHIR